MLTSCANDINAYKISKLVRKGRKKGTIYIENV